MVWKKGPYEVGVGTPENRKDIAVIISVHEPVGGHDGYDWAEVYDDPGYPVAEFFQPPDAPAIKVEDAIELLQRAVAILAERPRPPEK